MTIIEFGPGVPGGVRFVSGDEGLAQFALEELGLAASSDGDRAIISLGGEGPGGLLELWLLEERGPGNGLAAWHVEDVVSMGEALAVARGHGGGLFRLVGPDGEMVEEFEVPRGGPRCS